MLIKSYELGKVLPVPTDLTFSSPKTLVKQTKQTELDEVLFEVKFPNVVAIFVALDICRIYRAKYIESRNTQPS